jgi:hypothetical protein
VKRKPDCYIEHGYIAQQLYHAGHLQGKSWNNKSRMLLSALFDIYLQALQWNLTKDNTKQGMLMSLLATTMLEFEPVYKAMEQLHSLVLAAKANSDYMPNWTQAMNGPDQDGYWAAM